MIYYKTTDENGFISVSTVNSDGYGNITAEEYEALLGLIVNTPDGKALHDDGSEQYSYVDISYMDDEPDFDEILSILMGESV